MHILVLKYDEINWDIVAKNGSFAYSYNDEEFGFIKIQYHGIKIDKPMATYDGLIEYTTMGNTSIKEYDKDERMTAEIFELTAKNLISNGESFEVISKEIFEESTDERERLATSAINEFLFGQEKE